MLRLHYQLTLKDIDQAAERYQRGLGATVMNQVTSPEGVNVRTVLNVFEHSLVLRKLPEGQTPVTGNVIQLCVQLGEDKGQILEHAYRHLKVNASVIHELGPCSYSQRMAEFVDEFGVHWCLYL